MTRLWRWSQKTMIYTRRRALSLFESLRLTRAPEGRLNHKALRMLDIALMTHNLDSEFELFFPFSLSRYPILPPPSSTWWCSIACIWIRDSSARVFPLSKTRPPFAIRRPRKLMLCRSLAAACMRMLCVHVHRTAGGWRMMMERHRFERLLFTMVTSMYVSYIISHTLMMFMFISAAWLEYILK